MRRSLAILASIGLGIGTIALASPAQATETPTCQSDVSSIVTIAPGDALTFSPGDNCDSIAFSALGEASQYITLTVDGSDLSSGSSLSPIGGDVVLAVSADAPEGPLVQAFVVFQAAGSNAPVHTYGVYVGSEPDSGSSAPASELQQFGLPASGNCEDGATEAMNWSGIGTGGWGISWAQWMNEGAGGAVCTRTVMYDTSTAKWVVN